MGSTAEDEIRENLFLQFDANDVEDDSKVTPVCNSCEYHNIANSLCEDYEEHLCDDCVKAHQRVKLTKDHKINAINIVSKSGNARRSSTGSSYSVTCSTHAGENLAVFCMTCDVLTCRKCQLSEKH